MAPLMWGDSTSPEIPEYPIITRIRATRVECGGFHVARRFAADEGGAVMVEFLIVMSMTLTVFAAGGHVLGPPLFAVFERMIAETIAARDVLLELEAALSCTAS